MRALRTFRLRLRSLLQPRHVDQELDAELRDHLDRQIESHIVAGLSPADARRAALRGFGNVAAIEEQCRDMRRVSLFEDLVRDLRYALRSMRRSPGYSAAAVLSFALGIGANAAIFSLVNALMLRSLPVARPHELVEIGRVTQYSRGSFAYPIYLRLRDENSTLAGTLTQSNTTVQATVDTDGAQPIGRFVSGNYFEVLGLSPSLGRLLGPDDDRPNASAGTSVAVISHALWRRQFGGSPTVLGTPLMIDKVPFSTVGVLPQGFEGLEVGRPVDFLIPIASEPRLRRQSWLDNSDFNWLSIVGRLKPGLSVAAAKADLEPVFGRFLNDFASRLPDADAQRNFRSHRLTVASARAGLSRLRSQFGTSVLLLMGAVTLVLLVACANVVNLLLARAVARRREIALRLSIGASRGRLVRQLLTESALLGGVGGVTGLALAWWGTLLLVAFISDGDPTLALDVAPDARVLWFTSAISIGASLLAGLVPTLRASRASIMQAQSDARTLHVSRGASRWSRALIVAQVSLALVLLTGAMLLVASLRNFQTMDAGFDREHVLVMGLNPDRGGYAGDSRLQYYRQVLDRVRAVPGVGAASLSMVTPIAGGGVDLSLAVEGQPREPGAVVYVNYISDGYFTTMATRLVLGRDFGVDDRPDSPPMAVINEALARRYFQSASPIGRRVTLGRRDSLEIVGVVESAKYLSLREDDHPTIYLSALQRRDTGGLTLAVRASAGNPLSLAPPIRSEVQALAATVPIGRSMTLASQVDRSLVNERLVARLLGAFAGLALLLASIGLYGMLAYAVTRRIGEIGLRLALGATRRGVLLSVLGQSWRLVAVGTAIGVAASLALTRLLSTLLYGVTPQDPWVLAGAVSCLFTIALVAASLPAWRASRVDPLVALRHE